MLDNMEQVTAAKPPQPPKPPGDSDYDTAWQTWSQDRSPKANAALLQTTAPLIDRAARANVGKVDPLVRSRARSLALEAFASYDPQRGRFSSHLYNHLQGLKRYSGQLAQGVHVPERQVLDRKAMTSAQAQLNDELGRDPSDDELADRTGFSIKRLRQLRAPTAMTQGYFSTLGTGGEGLDPAIASNGSPAWLELIYAELNPLDQKVFEWSLGWNGQPQMQNQDIARRLRRSPGWVSQRKLLIQRMLDQEQELSPFGA